LVQLFVTTDLLEWLDDTRRAAGKPSENGRVVREFSPDGKECRIVHSRCAPDELDEVLRQEKSLADAGGYALEWKTYGHDGPPGLEDRLLDAGFEPDDVESVLAFPLTARTLAAIDAPAHEIRHVHDETGLADVAEISREVGRSNVEEELARLAAVLRETPDEMSVHVAYSDGEPVACGRLYLPPRSAFAELAGGRTKSSHRNKGLFTALVAARLTEALERDRTHVFVDALPTSEPILRKRGFRFVTRTRPYLYEPAS
jgi:hypothetical protein